MKKFSLIAFLLAALFCMSSCDNQFNSTPELDKTLLWPAQSDTCALWGYINEKGEMFIPQRFLEAYYFSCGRAKVVLEDNRHAFIDQHGQVLYALSEGEKCDNYFYYGFCRFSNADGLYGMFDTDFNLVIPDEYTSLGRMSKEGIVSAEKGYLDKNGKTILQIPYAESLSNFCDGVAVVTTWEDIYEEDYWGATHYRLYNDGAIDTKGKLVIDTIYERLYSVENNRLVYVKNGGYGLLDLKGNVLTPPMYYDFYWYGEGGLMPVLRGNRWMYIDKNGKMALSEMYTGALPFTDGVAYVVYDYKVEGYDSNRMLINRQGKIVLSLKSNQYLQSTFNNGLAKILEYTYNEENGEYKKEFKYIDKKGNVVYSWLVQNNPYYSPAAKKPAEMDEDEMMLRMFEGTEYYPLAEQCVQSRREREKQPR